VGWQIDSWFSRSSTVKVSWVFDVVSPYAYLAFQRLSQLPATTTVEYVPVLFAGLLSHFGQLGPAEIAPKRRFTYRFVLWRARQLGIPMHWPKAHPFNPLTAQRLIIAAGSDRQSVKMVFDAIFAEGRDIQDPQVIDDLSRTLGVADVSSAVNNPAIKQQLRDNTEWAIARGVFGVPTLVIDEETFWGLDAIDMALDYLGDPQLFNDSEMQRLDRMPIGVMRKARE
jgi:2-hydroxychromene-2-carboxylate isomerase